MTSKSNYCGMDGSGNAKNKFSPSELNVLFLNIQMRCKEIDDLTWMYFGNIHTALCRHYYENVKSSLFSHR